jgi:arginase family enzyme
MTATILPIYINIDSPDDKDANAKIKHKYNHTFDRKLYSQDSSGQIKIYDEIYKYFLENTKNKKLITFSSDSLISMATIAGINETYIKKEDDIYTSDLRIIYIDSEPNISIDNKNAKNEIISTLMGFIKNSIFENKLILRPEQIIYLGLNDKLLNCDDIQTLNDLNIKYFTLKKIKNMGIAKILEYIGETFESHPIHVVFDVKSLDKKLSPSSYRTNSFGIDTYILTEIIKNLKNKINTLDIVGFIPNEKNTNADRITVEIIRTIAREIFDIKEKKINIFSEDSRFLIYRPIEQKCDGSCQCVCEKKCKCDIKNTDKCECDYLDDCKCAETKDCDDNCSVDIGWYIMRLTMTTIEERNSIMEKSFEDNIISITLDDGEEYYVTSTTVNEQNLKSYYTAKSVMDICLFPQEKFLMAFELIYSPDNMTKVTET